MRRAALVAIWLAACGGSERRETIPPATPAPVEARAEAPPPAEPPPAEPAPAEPPPAEPESAHGSTVTTDADLDRVLARGTGVPACDEYLRVMAACIRHPSFPPDAARAARDALVQMSSGFQFDHMEPQARQAAQQAASDACRQATEAMRQASAEVCPGAL
jgi:hypothetical protein